MQRNLLDFSLLLFASCGLLGCVLCVRVCMCVCVFGGIGGRRCLQLRCCDTGHFVDLLGPRLLFLALVRKGIVGLIISTKKRH